MKKTLMYGYLIVFSFFININADSPKKLAVLVTGGAGYIGSHITLLMSQKGYEVVVLDHNVKKTYPWAHYVESDFADEKTLSEIFTNYSIESVFHCAAFAIVPNSFKQSLEFYENNVAKTLLLLKIMRKFDVNKFIFASSRSIYGDAQYSPITEDHPKNPLSPYARSKLFVELILEDCSKAYGLKYVNLRFVNAVGAMPEYGLGEDHKPETHVWPLLMHAAKYHVPFTIYGTDYNTHDGSCVRSYIHVWDIAQANYLAFEYLKNGGESNTFQLGSEIVISIKEMIKAAEEFYNTKIIVLEKPRRAADSPDLITDYSKAQTILAWEPHYSTLKNILSSMDAFGV